MYDTVGFIGLKEENAVLCIAVVEGFRDIESKEEYDAAVMSELATDTTVRIEVNIMKMGLQDTSLVSLGRSNHRIDLRGEDVIPLNLQNEGFNGTGGSQYRMLEDADTLKQVLSTAWLKREGNTEKLPVVRTAAVPYQLPFNQQLIVEGFKSETKAANVAHLDQLACCVCNQVVPREFMRGHVALGWQRTAHLSWR